MPPKFTRDLYALEVEHGSDAYIYDYMKQKRLDHKRLVAPVIDWMQLDKRRQGRIAAKLGGVAFPRGGPTKGQLPNLERIADMLMRLIVLDIRHAQGSPPLSVSPREALVRADMRSREMLAFQELVKDGGRPIYHMDHVDYIMADLEKYRQLLRPFGAFPGDCNDIFSKQLKRWQDFRRWQRDNRNQSDPADGYEDYVERQRLQHEREREPGQWQHLVRHPEALHEGFLAEKQLRNNRRKIVREIAGRHGFEQYVRALKRRLRRHGVHTPVVLAENVAAQGLLATWVEYLAFELWWLDRYRSELHAQEPPRRHAWARLQDDGLVDHDETPDDVKRPPCQEVQAFLNETADFRRIRHTAETQEALAQWVRDQIPAVELEVACLRGKLDPSRWKVQSHTGSQPQPSSSGMRPLSPSCGTHAQSQSSIMQSQDRSYEAEPQSPTSNVQPRGASYGAQPNPSPPAFQQPSPPQLQGLWGMFGTQRQSGPFQDRGLPPPWERPASSHLEGDQMDIQHD